MISRVNIALCQLESGVSQSTELKKLVLYQVVDELKTTYW